MPTPRPVRPPNAEPFLPFHSWSAPVDWVVTAIVLNTRRSSSNEKTFLSAANVSN